MSRDPTDDSVPELYEEQIDAQCDAFERAWKTGREPRLETFVEGVTGAKRAYLLRELLALEIQLRRDDAGKPLAGRDIAALHPELEDELATIVPRLERQRSTGQRTTASALRGNLDAASDVRCDESSDARGLQIRCPYCRNSIEVVTDTPYEDIMCRSCGSSFNLVNRDEPTRVAATLRQIDRFELIARLGVGGFGSVWKARDIELDRVVAIKMPRKGELSPEETEYFFREARAAAQLHHPNIVPVFEVGREDDSLFIVSAFVRGSTLDDWLTARLPGPRDGAQLCVRIADALHHAHQKGVIHRDLKPSNVMIDDNWEPCIMDFGLAKRDAGEITMTVDGQIVGTPAYMSPEQARGKSHWTDCRTDIYSLGVVLFRLLTGDLPYRGNSQVQIQQKLTEDAPDPRKLNRHVPADLSTICLKCLEREPTRRYPTARAVAEELKRYLAGEPIRTRPISRIQRTARWAKRKPALAAAICLSVLLATAGPVTAWQFHRKNLQLEDALRARNSAVRQIQQEKESDLQEISRLRKALDGYEGREDPWGIWPPRPTNDPRVALLHSLLTPPVEAAAAKRNADALNSRDALHLGLAQAIASDLSGDANEAARQYRDCIDRLREARRRTPQRIDYARAEADCLINLARLSLATDRQASRNFLDQAEAIYAGIDSSSVGLQVQADEFVSQIYRAALVEYGAGQVHLDRAKEVFGKIQAELDGNPAKLYHLACFLAHRTPLLSDAPNDERTEQRQERK